MDAGSGINLIYTKTLRAMHISLDFLKPTDCSPEVDRASRQRCRSRNEDSRTRRNQIAAGYERRNEEGNKNREHRENNSWEREKSKYFGPSAEDMLHGPCRIHYTYLDGKRVSNHQMKDCRTFLRLQGALELDQGTHQGDRNTSQ
jgi:hypothetical protein